METGRITIIRARRPAKREVNEELKWLGISLGLFGMRDKDSSCFRIFIELLKSSRQKEALTSDMVAYRLRLTRGTVIHHINKLMESGIVVSDKNRYMLRAQTLSYLIDDIESDFKHSIDELKKVAKEIDSNMGF